MLLRLPSSTVREIVGTRARIPIWLAETVDLLPIGVGCKLDSGGPSRLVWGRTGVTFSSG